MKSASGKSSRKTRLYRAGWGLLKYIDRSGSLSFPRYNFHFLFTGMLAGIAVLNNPLRGVRTCFEVESRIWLASHKKLIFAPAALGVPWS
jgi:hypothetical protein